MQLYYAIVCLPNCCMRTNRASAKVQHLRGLKNHRCGYDMDLGRTRCLVIRSDILISSLELFLNRRCANLRYEEHSHWYRRFAKGSYKLQATIPFRSLVTSYDLRARAAVSL